MPAPISPSSSSSSPRTTARISFLVQMVLGGSLAAIVLFLGVIFWRLAQLPYSDKPTAKHLQPARITPAEPRKVFVAIQPQNGPEDPEYRKDFPKPVQPVDVPASQPKEKSAASALPRLPEPLTADQIFEQRLQVSEDDLRRQLYDVPELRLLADEDVRDLRAEQKIAMRNALQDAIAAVRNERMRVKAARAAEERRVQAALAAEERYARSREARSILHTIASNERAVRAAAFAQDRRTEAAFTTAAQQKVAYEFSHRLQQSMQQAASQAGLTLQRGPGSQLVSNDAAGVAELSKDLRDLGFMTALAAPSPRRGGRRHTIVRAEADGDEGAAVRRAKTFQKWCDQHRIERLSGAVPTLAQMLQIEDEPTRLLLVRELTRIRTRASTGKLAERAIMDLSPEVRRAAVAALSRRSPTRYVPILTRGLRYPWPPVADHAAAALRTLKPLEAVAPLVGLLDLPSPSLPVLDARTQQYAVPELVRLNHMRNCLLCHAISANKEDGLVRGLVPTPGLSLPMPTSGGSSSYYEAVSGDFVRADTTYVHQDFSIVLLDEDVAPWPREQRYDFVTRLRPVPPEAVAKLSSPLADSPQRDAVLYALRGITGKDGGNSSDEWRTLLGIAKEDSTDKRSIRPLTSGITVKVSTPP